MLHYLVIATAYVVANTDTGYFMSSKADYECTANNLFIADVARDHYKESKKYSDVANQASDAFVGYPDGSCGFVQTQDSCQANSNYDFLTFYYCDLRDTIGYGNFRFLIGGCLISVSSDPDNSS